MRLLESPARETRASAVAEGGRAVGRFARHLLEMCMVMCGGAILLSLAFFGAAGLLGYTNLPERAPVLSAVVIAVNLSVPMALWMRHRGMGWQPTLEMSGSTMLTGVVLIAAYLLGLIGKASLIEVQTSLACPVMVAVMLLRFRLYSAPHDHTGPAAHAA